MSILNSPLQFADFRRLPAIWPKDWTLPFISLALAVALWYFVGGDDTVDKNVMVPVEIINLPRDLVISNQFKREIMVTISGPRKQLLAIGPGEIIRPVDLSQAVAGTKVVNNENHSISVPRGVKVLRIQPDSIIFSLEKLIQKQLAVKPVTHGQPAAHFVLQKITMKPETISVAGPQGVLANIDSLQTQEIDIAGMEQSIQLQVPLNLNADILNLIGETTVTADLSIVEEAVEKRVSGVPVDLGAHNGMRQISPATVTVTALIPRSMARERKELASLFQATVVDTNEAGQMSIKVVPRQGAAASIQVLKIDPLVVSYTVADEAMTDSPSSSSPPAGAAEKK